MAGARPFKIWNQDRSVKKGIVASSLQELVQKGKDKLGITSTDGLRVVIAEDGTEVDDEDYFVFLPHNSTLMILPKGQMWRPEGIGEVSGHDEPDFIGGGTEISERSKEMIAGLQKNITRIITLSNEDLQLIVDLAIGHLAHLLQDTENYAKTVQEACQRHLDERSQTTQALDLLQLYHNARQNSPFIGDDETKRQKLANT
ncbi:DNA fragmentation factor, 45 kD, alpha subunit [Mytilus galloprovincialis]|uniref:DNAation factor, 45 kD, alpha subunit n=2 Tax=Mytilus galloprovincialis TaxID=29158 RepID=A0A8B6DRB1_MYTGA